MQTMTDRREVAANTTVSNVLTGKLHEFLAQNSIIRVGATAEAIGGNISVLVGNETFVQDQELGAQNRFPLDPDDFYVDAAGVAGDRILVSVRNTTGAAFDFFTKVQIIPV